jgi:hypothetical protein
MSKEAVIEKIKKLLRMKRGGTPGEIENALAAAAKLAREHGIDLENVNPDEQSDAQRITHATEVLGLRLPLEARFAAAIPVNFFNVQILFKQALNLWFVKKNGSITFVGTAWDCEVARYVFVFLQQHFRYSWNHRQNRRLKNREAFLHGMFLGLAAKLEAQQVQPEPGVGLIRIERALQLRKDYLAKLCPNAKDKPLPKEDSEAWKAKRAGIEEGRKTEIRSGLKDSPVPARPALPPAAGQLTLI